jgi:hypothetical protein
VGQAFFPLARRNELELLPGSLTPSLQEDVIHLGTWMPFGKAVQAVRRFRRTEVSRPTAERLTEAAGAAYVAYQNEEARQIEREMPEPPAGPAQLFMSADGAMVPLVGGEWAEVKTLAIGEVQPPQKVKGEWVIRTAKHSYFSRLTDAETFQRLALVETQRRGVETAAEVAFVTDGAEWLQKFAHHHRSDAVRILDFPHAGEHIAAVGQACLGEGSSAAQEWLKTQLHELKRNGPDAVIAEVAHLVATRPQSPDLATHLAYLEKRKPHMNYPAFLAAGWPIGDGATESANKLVVEARLKGSGMHWDRCHVDPMLALRNIVCNDRWDEAWPQIVQTLRRQEHQRRNAHRERRRAANSNAAIEATTLHPMGPSLPVPPPAPIMTAHISPPTSTHLPASDVPTQPKQPWRPPANHPWRHMPVGKARFKPTTRQANAKL